NSPILDGRFATTMSAIEMNAAVGQLVAERPGRARVFERWGIDYCCGGSKPLEAACRERALPVEAVVSDLRESDASQEADEEGDWSNASLSALADHIVAIHHAYLRRELPRLAEWMEKVLRAHGERHPELAEVHRGFETLMAELRIHIIKEENVLFP